MKPLKYPNLFTPITIGNVTFKNRVWSAPAGVHLLYGRDPYPSEEAMAYYVEKAKGGCAVITYSGQNMDLEEPNDPIHACENILDPTSHRFFSKFTSMLHAQDVKVSLELLAFCYHHIEEDGQDVLLSVNGGYDEDMEEETRAFTREDLERIAESYADAAEAALACGFDMLLIHGGHGLVISQFYSRELNHRTDEFSADTIENRMRFADMVIDAIRARVGRRLLIEYRISGEEDPLHHTGYTIEDCIEMIKHLQDRIDIAHVSTGAFYNETENITHPTEFLDDGCNVKYAAAVKACKDIHIPVLTLGAIQDAPLAEEIISSGKADMVAMARGLISDASRVNKWKCGREDEAIHCIKCFHCLNYTEAPTFACSVNPTVGRETQLKTLFPAQTEPKKVVIVGGGPAGLEAALTAMQRGHKVTLIEKQAVLGGKLNFAKDVPFKRDLYKFMTGLAHQVEKAGAQILLNTEADAALIERLAPDAVISAVGSNPFILPIEGIHGENVITAEDAYHYAAQKKDMGKKIAVLGGGLVGCETALYLAQYCGYDVTILEMKPEVAEEEMYLTRDALLDRLSVYTTVITGAACRSVTDTAVTYLKNGETGSVECDTVVLSAGYRPDTQEAEKFRFTADFYCAVGDCSKVSNVRGAVHTGYDAAMRI